MSGGNVVVLLIALAIVAWNLGAREANKRRDFEEARRRNFEQALRDRRSPD